MKKAGTALLIFFSVLMFIHTSVFADSNNDVIINVTSAKETYSVQFNVDLKIQFINKELYNEKIYLAYHLYDRNNNELLWEGQRFPIRLNDNGVGEVNINADLSTGLKPLKAEYALIKFDLVDEKNTYWFSTNPEVKMMTDDIVYTDDYMKKFISSLISPVAENPFTFGVNIIFFLLCIFLFYKINKSQLFTH